jgi:hypothetical protein
MSDVVAPRKITVSFTDEAKAEWRSVPEPIRQKLLAYIQENARRSHEQMCVLGWTCDPDSEHIFRAYKIYQTRPSYRIIFHHEGCWNNLVIDRVAARGSDPYRDGH